MPDWPRRSARIGKAEDLIEVARHLDFIAPEIGAGLQILGDRQVGEDAAAFRHMGDAELDDLLGRQAVDAPAVEPDFAGARRRQARDRAQRRRLARAVGADQGHDVARADLDRHALEGGDLVVMDVDVGQAKQHVRRRQDRPR